MSPGPAVPDLLLYFAAQNAVRPRARDRLVCQRPEYPQVIGTRGKRRSEVKEEGWRSQPGGHSRSRFPRVPMTALVGAAYLAYRGHRDSSERYGLAKPKIDPCLRNVPSNP